MFALEQRAWKVYWNRAFFPEAQDKAEWDDRHEKSPTSRKAREVGHPRKLSDCDASGA
jgi:hypothetical protein